MSGFAPEWLALREPVDHSSRDAALAQALMARFAGKKSIAVIDLGSGTGSNLRETFALLPARQHWTLVDYDPVLLAAAMHALAAWADSAAMQGGDAVLVKGDKTITVTFRQADLSADASTVLAAPADLITASALFDLTSPAFMRTVAASAARQQAVFYTVLTYNGQLAWDPPHESDAPIAEAFNRHQMSEKGFGIAAGPSAPSALAAAFRDAGYKVEEGDSPWRLGDTDAALAAQLNGGVASAVEETGSADPASLRAWRARDRRSTLVGHTDTLAFPL